LCCAAKNAGCILLLGVLVRPAAAQVVLNPQKDTSVITVNVNLVNILCAVRDKRGAYVKGLSKDDFEVREDGRRQEITHFAREVDTPLTVALLLDVSGSVQKIVGIEKAAARQFFSEVLRRGDQALLVGFASLIVVWQDLTPSVATLGTALESAGPFAMPMGPEVHPRGGTLLYDAVDLVAAQKLKGLPGRKTILLITDGQDNGSLVNRAAAVKAAQEADAVVYGIHYEEGFPGLRSGLGALQDLSDPTGGRTFHVGDKMPLEAVFAAIGEEMRNQYGLAYPAPGTAEDGAFHRLEVKALKPGLKVQVRTGYYRN